VDAIDRARDYLLTQAAAGFPEVRHTMRFLRRAGFRLRTETQSSDVFARAVLGALLLDIAELMRDAAAANTFRDLARREAQYVASARLQDRAGGWSYFPDLPDLPPDADSLGAALALFARAAPELARLCEEPVALALKTQGDDGSIETWILADKDSGALRKRMLKGIAHHWGRDRAVDVVARFIRALQLHDPRCHRDAIDRGLRFVRQSQQPDGAWLGEWYAGPYYTTMLALDVLDIHGADAASAARAAAMVYANRRDDGGWGKWQSVPLDISIALWLLACVDRAAYRGAIRRGLRRLLDYQTQLGFWNPSPWIKMDVGRARNKVLHTLTHQSETLTTALCLRTLLLLQDELNDLPA